MSPHLGHSSAFRITKSTRPIEAFVTCHTVNVTTSLLHLYFCAQHPHLGQSKEKLLILHPALSDQTAAPAGGPAFRHRNAVPGAGVQDATGARTQAAGLGGVTGEGARDAHSPQPGTSVRPPPSDSVRGAGAAGEERAPGTAVVVPTGVGHPGVVREPHTRVCVGTTTPSRSLRFYHLRTSPAAPKVNLAHSSNNHRQ